ncbi:threonine-phosphate decarboxylase CobD [Thauera aromatica]|uniref:threonine-phosphate decarboxylase n=1 Tax=Thauera aromatica K172 TaxID=44139 RepID=A0A2R4BJB5_THAAR|nr:threonine-phosphate decarboxylase CobD [Thauera aromatica]AVR87399.1 L-threonine 3-O-phosphate decarboxylase CobC [Thauera aromatica K172]
MLEHGGRLRRAAREHGIPLADWLDLSTGVNPHAYPAPPVPAAAWQRLPEDDDGLEDAAARYYGSVALLPVAGSQPAIQALPAALLPAWAAGRAAHARHGAAVPPRVTLLAPSYAEHAHAWRGCAPALVSAENIAAAVDRSDIVVLVQPNNPTGALFERAHLLDWHARLARRGGWLVVDEAFIDTVPEASLAPAAGVDGLVVLRSLGKFFGLAGARVGFVLAPAHLRRVLADTLGPWTLSGPARLVARQALADHAWQARTRTRLRAEGERLQSLLAATGFAPTHGPALFKWVPTPHAAALHAHLARRGILSRLFDTPPAVRFGLPPDEHGWQRLEAALQACGEALHRSGNAPAGSPPSPRTREHGC